MIILKRIRLGATIAAGIYILLPLVIFNFGEAARPYDEENFNGREVAIGPKPPWWVPGAAWKIDMPSGCSYDAGEWPFVCWKPLCIAFVKVKGYAPPSAWRK